ncbi:MAG: DHH family phosphoesterase [Candidatus Bathyarchaeota archaeon]|nr:DHH family phosphoesterase [Candidatus Bathyarchaeota archaeon]
MSRDYTRFVDEAGKLSVAICERAYENQPVMILGHNDADGISATAIAAKILYRAGVKFHARVIRRLDASELERASSSGRMVILCDMGSGYLHLLSKYSWVSGLAILDHHKPEVAEPPSDSIHVNPHLYGVDGESEISGAGVAYIALKGFPRVEYRDLSILAIVGALADMQDVDVGRSLKGVNKLIVEEAERDGYIGVQRDLLLPGRESRPLHTALAGLVNPFIPGLSGDEDACVSFLSKLGISLKESGRWRTLSDLSKEEKQMLFNELLRYLAENNYPTSILKNLIGVSYILQREKRFSYMRDAREYASLLNACSRMGLHGLALTIAMGDRRVDLIAKAEAVYGEYRGKISSYIRTITSEPGRIVSMGKFYLVRCLDLVEEDLLSVVASIITESYLADRGMPVIAISGAVGGEVKVSARLPRSGRVQAIDLGLVMRRAASRVGGEGGGHSVAAGAYIAKDRIEDFLAALIEEMGG